MKSLSMKKLKKHHKQVYPNPTTKKKGEEFPRLFQYDNNESYFLLALASATIALKSFDCLVNRMVQC